MRRKWLGFPLQGKVPGTGPSAAHRSRPSKSPHAARLGSAPPGLCRRRRRVSPAPGPHSLFLRKRSSCSTAMALTQSRAACSSEYRVKAMVTGRQPEAQPIRLQPPRGTWHHLGRRPPTAAEEDQNALPEKLHPQPSKPRPTLTSVRPVRLAV